MNELSQLTRQHHEKNEAGTSLVSKVATILDSLPAGPVDALQLAGLDQFHVMGLEATDRLARFAGIESGTNILDAGSGLGGPSRYLASTYGCRVVGVDLSPSFVAVAQLLAQRTGLNVLVSYQAGDLLALLFPDSGFDVVWTQHVVMKAPFGNSFIGVPDVVSGQIDVLPAYRRQVRQKRFIDRAAIVAERFDGAF